MRKTAVYTSKEIKRVNARRSRHEINRDSLRAATSESSAPRPRLPLFESGKPGLAERIGQALAGFGRP